MRLGKRWALQSAAYAVLVIVVLLVVVGYQLWQYSIDVAGEKARVIAEHRQNIIGHALYSRISYSRDVVDTRLSGPVLNWLMAGYIQERAEACFKSGNFDQYYFKTVAVNARAIGSEADQHRDIFLEKVCQNSGSAPCPAVIEFEDKLFYRYTQVPNIGFAGACVSCHASPEGAFVDSADRLGPVYGFSVGGFLQENSGGKYEIVIGLSVLCGILFAFFFFFQLFIAKRSMVAPLKQITAQFIATARGERPLGEVIRLSGGDEFSELASAFSEMSQNLAHSQDNLESLLKERGEQLLQLREQSQAYLDIATVMLVTLDCSGAITMINARGCEILGISQDEAIGLDWFAHFSSDEKKEFFYQLLRENITVESHCSSIVTRSGEIRSIDFHSVLLRDSGSGVAQGRLCSGTDITEQKQAETFLLNSIERFKTIFEQAPVGYQLLDDRGILLDVNKTWLEYLGYEKGEVVGEPFTRFVHADERSRFEEDFSRLQETKRELRLEHQILKRDGTSVLMTIDGRMYYDAKVAYKKIHCVFHDISRERRIEAEKAKLEEQLCQAQKMETVGVMAGGIAHDFNNILAVILGNAEMVRDDIPADTPAGERVDEVIRASARAKSLVRQILSFSRKEKMKLMPIHPQLLVREALKFLRSTTPSTISLVQDISKECGVILLDPIQLHQLVMNLVVNAAHAIEDKGEVIVRLHSVQLSSADFAQLAIATPCDRVAGEYVQLSVADSGEGMESERIDRIFDLFYTTKGAGQGTGMGLALVHEIVKNHGGFITVESTLGQGSVFSVYFPVTDKEEASQEKHSNAIVSGTERILFVDDEQAILTMGQQMLEGMGYAVVAESSSQRALERFKADAHGFDLLITDQTMPNMSGTELIEEVLKIRADMRIILCTGHNLKISSEDTKLQEINRYMLTKPYGKKILSARIREALAGR